MRVDVHDIDTPSKGRLDLGSALGAHIVAILLRHGNRSGGRQIADSALKLRAKMAAAQNRALGDKNAGRARAVNRICAAITVLEEMGKPQPFRNITRLTSEKAGAACLSCFTSSVAPFSLTGFEISAS